MVNTFNSTTIVAFNLLASLLFGHSVFAGELKEPTQANETLPGMELLIYLGGWEINDQEAEEPLYWHNMDSADKQSYHRTDQHNSATEADKNDDN